MASTQMGEFNASDIDAMDDQGLRPYTIDPANWPAGQAQPPFPVYEPNTPPPQIPADTGASSLAPDLSSADLTGGLPDWLRSTIGSLRSAGNALSFANTDAGGEPVGGLLSEGAFNLPQSKTDLAIQAAAALPVGKVLKYGKPTVTKALRTAFPGIYQNPAEMVAEAASRVADESPLLKDLFGVTRGDLWDISQQGTREGNMIERPFQAAANPKGAKHAPLIMVPGNAQRLQDIIAEAQKYPDLYRPMASWYTMDPLFEHFQRLYGDKAVDAYSKFNTLVGMASPGSEVMTEINRGTAAYWLATEERFNDFLKYAGKAEDARGRRFPDDMRAIVGHPYHKTAQGTPMQNYLLSGDLLGMKSAKVPSYIWASGVPETGFQTSWPVGDAHWSRLLGLADVRRGRSFTASASVPEMISLAPWFRDEVARPMGLQAVPAQAVVWGAGSGATGVTSPIGAGKLELLAIRIGEAAKRLGITPQAARDLVLSGKTHAAIAGGALGLGALQVQHPLTSPEPEYDEEQ